MKHRRKIFIGLMTTMLLAVTLVTSTFAWISQTTTATVSGFDFSVNGGQGFLVSLDDVNYSNDITSAMMKRAIVRGYNPDRYEIDNGELYEVVGDKKYLQDDLMVQSALSNIELLPLTSNDGINLSDLYGSNIYSTSGRYVEFTIYVKAASPNVDDNMTYGIYLAGEDITLPHTSTVIPKCSFVSEVTQVDLKNKMTINTGEVFGPDETVKSIDVYTSNCLRMSVEDVSKNDFIKASNEELLKNDSTATTTPLEPAKIFELNDTVNGDKNFGSYATDYDKTTDTNTYGADSTEDANTKDELNKLYNSSINAMFTYYNTLRPYSKLSAREYASIPNTFKVLDKTDSNQELTKVSSGGKSTKLTFRLWIEGWDADCFDGLSKSVRVNLTLTSIKL